MSIVRLYSFRVNCDTCGKHGGVWNEREKPEDALPDGWTMYWSGICIDKEYVPDFPASHRVLCPECQKEESRGQ